MKAFSLSVSTGRSSRFSEARTVERDERREAVTDAEKLVTDAASAVVLPPAISKLDAPKRPQKELSSASSQTVPMWRPNA